MKLRAFAAGFVAFAVSSSFLIAQSSAGAEGQSGSDAAQMNEQARHQLDVVLRSNGLVGPDVKPWHLKVDFQMSRNSAERTEMVQRTSMEEW